MTTVRGTEQNKARVLMSAPAVVQLAHRGRSAKAPVGSAGTLAFVIATLLAVCPASATTWHVPSQCPTIQAGIDSASAGDTVVVACGMYYEHDIVMKSGVCLRSEIGVDGCVTIDAEGQGRVLVCDGLDSTTMITGFTITRGYASVGGGIHGFRSSLHMERCTFSHNDADYGGGGAAFDSSDASFENCTFSDNSLHRWISYGGAMDLYGSSSAFSGCTFSGNSGGSGGAVWSTYGSPTFADCEFVSNTAGASDGGNGGAIGASRCSLTLTDCKFSDNRAWFGVGGAIDCDSTVLVATGCAFMRNSNPGGYYGGAVDCRASTVTLDRCAFLGNYTEWDGGAVSLYSAIAQITGCTMTGNEASEHSATILCRMGGELSMENTIISFSPSCAALICALGATAILTCCDVYGNAGGDWTSCIAEQYGIEGNISMDPLFCDPDNDDFRIDAASPCAPGNHPDGYSCGLIGVFDVGCDTSSAERETWGRLKAMYREHEVE